MTGLPRDKHFMPVTVGLHHLRWHRGFTLLEMLIALVLVLVLAAAVINIYFGGARSAQYKDGLQRMHENGRHAISRLQGELRLAGFSPTARLDPFDFTTGDAEALVLQTHQPYDCNGQATVSTNGLAVNTYRLNQQTQQLTCKGNQPGSVASPIVSGVDAFAVLYGVDEDGEPQSIEPQRYRPYAVNIDPASVVALRVALLVNSVDPVHLVDRRMAYTVLDKQLSTKDRLAREVFSSTVMIRNR